MKNAIPVKLTTVFQLCMFASLFILIGVAADLRDERITIAAYVLAVAMGLAEYAIGFHRGYLAGYEEALETFESWVDEPVKPNGRQLPTFDSNAGRRVRDDDPTLN